MRALLLLSLLAAGCSVVASSSPRPKTVSYVDLKRYMGRWYVIANVPYFLEKGKVASFDTYALRPDGQIENNFTFRKGSFDATEKTWHGTAKVVNTETNAEWTVQFIWPLRTTYLVFDLDPEYQWAVVGTPDRKLLWILARTRQLPDATHTAILQQLRQSGFDVSKLSPVPQPNA